MICAFFTPINLDIDACKNESIQIPSLVACFHKPPRVLAFSTKSLTGKFGSITFSTSPTKRHKEGTWPAILEEQLSHGFLHRIRFEDVLPKKKQKLLFERIWEGDNCPFWIVEIPTPSLVAARYSTLSHSVARINEH